MPANSRPAGQGSSLSSPPRWSGAAAARSAISASGTTSSLSRSAASSNSSSSKMPSPAFSSAIPAARRPWEGDGPLTRTAEIDDWDEWAPVAPSAIAHSEKWPAPRALARTEVKDLVQAWGNAARRANEAGFEVLELHGAHGYLMHEFLSEKSNHRTDEYGGSEQNRMRFITEVTEAVRMHWPEEKPLFVRLSVEDNAGWGPEQSARLAKILK